MKKTAYNSFLVLILAFLLLSPLGAFGFVGKQSDDPAVLGIVSVPETPNVNVKVMDQVDLIIRKNSSDFNLASARIA